MKAIVWTRYGPPEGLQLQEVPQPIPKEDEVLIRVHATTVSTPDTEIRRLKLPILFSIPMRLYFGVTKPTRKTILGSEFAGVIAAVGEKISLYQPGDEVFGYTGLTMGTYAEYLCLPENPSGMAGILARKPTNLTFEEASAITFGGLEALHALRRANVQSGQKVLIIGAGGSIGSSAVQLAKYYGAIVTGVDKPGKLPMLASIGADHLIDYTREDFTRNGQIYDVIFDTIGKSPFSRSLQSLAKNGTYLNDNPGVLGAIRIRLTARNNNQRVLSWTGDYSKNNLVALKELAEAGVIRAVIDRCYPFEQAVEAHRYVDSGEKKGNVVLTLIDQ